MSDTAQSLDDAPVTTWAGFLAMCLGMFMAILDIQVVVTSLPEIQRALAITPDRMSWVQTAYLIAEVIAIPLTGLLTRALTMRLLFVVAISVFTIASLGCASSGGFEALIAWRLLQGFAGGVLIPLVFSAVFLLFPHRQQGVATTIAGVLAVLAPTCGPLVGGYITQTYSWRWLFLINVAPGILSVIIATMSLRREQLDFGLLRKLDVLALMLLAVSLGSLEIALKEAPTRGWLSWAPMSLLAAFLIGGAIFVYRSVRNSSPIADLTAFADKNFTIGCALSFILGVGLYGSVYLMPVFLAYVRDHGSLDIGWIMLATGAAQLVMAPVAVSLDRRFDTRVLTCVGFLCFATGLFASSFANKSTDGAEMFWPQIVRGAAIMFCLLPPTRMALGHFAAARVSDASGLFNLMRNLGGAIGIALIDTIIYGRGPVITQRIADKVMAGDIPTATSVGATQDLLMQAFGGGPAETMLRKLIEHQGLTEAINEAWLVIAAVTVLGCLIAPFAKNYPKDDGVRATH